MNIAKQLLTTLLIVVGAAAFVLQSGCSYSGYSVRPEARHHSLAKAAADLNQVADPNLPSRTYTNYGRRMGDEGEYRQRERHILRWIRLTAVCAG